MKLRKIYQLIYYQFLKRHYYGITASSRVLPNFLIIGGVRCGTTSLYYNICKHPSILPAAQDEIGFFDVNFHLGLKWYRSMFPTTKQMNEVKAKTNFSITGEDTPFYFWREDAAKRIYNLLPNCKIIIILRHPVDRAYSNYQLGKRTGWEKLTFEQAIDAEKKQLEKGLDSSKFGNFRSYLAKSIYSYQIKSWLETFPRNQLQVLSTEELAKNVTGTMSNIFQFLGLPDYEITNSEKKEVGNYSRMKSNTRRDLLKFFKIYNEELFSLINKRFCWDE